MATPDFVLALREKIGTQRLWLASVTAVVLRGTEVLLVRRADTGEWTPVTGIIDPGEEPAVAAAREVLEEASIVAEPVRLVWVHTIPEIVYPNGDRSQYIDICFLFRYVSGEPFPADGENSEVAWFTKDALPAMSANMLERIRTAVEFDGTTRFER